jgi:hypothetical protein
MDDYPLINFFLLMLWFFLFVAWISLLIALFGDILRRDDFSGVAKGLWTFIIIVLPLLGTLIYLIAYGRGMGQRNDDRHRRSEEAVRSYIRDTAATGPSTADELTKLSQLRDSGTLTPAEFEAQKSKLLA